MRNLHYPQVGVQEFLKPFIVVGGKDCLIPMVGKEIPLSEFIDEPQQGKGIIW
jgi:hypothetical protein